MHRKPLTRETANRQRGSRTGGWSARRERAPRRAAARGHIQVPTTSVPRGLALQGFSEGFTVCASGSFHTKSKTVSGAWMDLLNYTIIQHVPNATTREYRTSELPDECERQSVTACVASPARAGARAVGRPSPLRATRSRRRPGTPALQHLFVVGHRHRRGEHAIRAAYSQQEV